MEFYCELRVNDKATGKLLARESVVIVDDKSIDFDEFTRQHEDEVKELLKNRVDDNDIDGYDTIDNIYIVMLADDFEDDDEQYSESYEIDCYHIDELKE